MNDSDGFSFIFSFVHSLISYPMTYQTWVLLFLGMVTAMLLYNIVQWSLYRERIYGLYTGYMLIWLVYFSVRFNRERLPFTEPGWEFVRIVMPNVAYLVYLGFTRAFLELRNWQETRLSRMLRLSQYLLFGYAAFETAVTLFTDFWRTSFHAVLFTAERLSLIGVALYTILNMLRRRDLVTRLFITGSLMLVVGGLTSVLLSLVWPGMERDSDPFWHAHLTYLHVGIILELLFFSVGLAFRHRREAIRKALVDKELAREREQRRREHAESALAVQQLNQQMTEMQMRALQAQINPHFLFNSLNSLSALIADDPLKAEKFVDEMATVYRYLLRSNEGGLTPLRQELRFLHSYYHLLKTRYGAGIDLRMDTDPTLLDHLLPPLTLQLLVENAVKHNVVAADAPLTIQVFTGPDRTLAVRNTLQRKPGNRVPSTRKGLLNIAEKYRLLGQSAIQIEETDGSFEVRVGLIQPETQPADGTRPTTA
jgi:sensor histidine kinase YesM